MIIYDLPHPILSAIPRPHLLQLQAATVQEETHRNAKYCNVCTHALCALARTHAQLLGFHHPVLFVHFGGLQSGKGVMETPELTK